MPIPIQMPPNRIDHHGKGSHHPLDGNDGTWPFDKDLHIHYNADGDLTYSPDDFFVPNSFKGKGHHRNGEDKIGGRAVTQGTTVTFTYNYTGAPAYVLPVTFV